MLVFTAYHHDVWRDGGSAVECDALTSTVCRQTATRVDSILALMNATAQLLLGRKVAGESSSRVPDDRSAGTADEAEIARRVREVVGPDEAALATARAATLRGSSTRIFWPPSQA